MLADDVLQPMYDLAYFLSPDPAVALTVTLEAADRLALLRRLGDHPTGHAWRRLPEAWWPQYCVYLASDPHERAHERLRRGRVLRERPTPDDYLIRYVKCLVWWTMDQHCSQMAVALGSCLYRYALDTLVQLVPGCYPPYEVQRIRARLMHRLQDRFPRAYLFQGNHGTRRTRLLTVHDQQLVQQALARFTPWGTAHVPPPALDQSLLDTHFAQASPRSNGDRIHALINPVDGGLPRLIREYNQAIPPGSAQRLADPYTRLAIPRFAR
jgi:hypothetical protein